MFVNVVYEFLARVCHAEVGLVAVLLMELGRAWSLVVACNEITLVSFTEIFQGFFFIANSEQLLNRKLIPFYHFLSSRFSKMLKEINCVLYPYCDTAMLCYKVAWISTMIP